MGLATIDPHSRKVQTKLYKIPKFGVNRPNSKQDTAIWKWQNLPWIIYETVIIHEFTKKGLKEIATIQGAFDITTTTIPYVSQKRFQDLFKETFSSLESCLRLFASGSLTAAAIKLHSEV